jgi:hypothetical protein
MLMMRVERWSFGKHYHCRMAGVVVERIYWVWAVGECCRYVVAVVVVVVVVVVVLTAVVVEVRLYLKLSWKVGYQNMLQSAVGRIQLGDKEHDVRFRLDAVENVHYVEKHHGCGELWKQ